jgi:hypothetical protein
MSAPAAIANLATNFRHSSTSSKVGGAPDTSCANGKESPANTQGFR